MDQRRSLTWVSKWSHDLMYALYRQPDSLVPILDLFDAMLFEHASLKSHPSGWDRDYYERAWTLLGKPLKAGEYGRRSAEVSWHDRPSTWAKNTAEWLTSQPLPH